MDIDLFGLCFLYDMVFIENYVIFMDLLVWFCFEVLKECKWMVDYYCDVFVCFGVILCCG